MYHVYRVLSKQTGEVIEYKGSKRKAKNLMYEGCVKYFKLKFSELEIYDLTVLYGITTVDPFFDDINRRRKK